MLTLFEEYQQIDSQIESGGKGDFPDLYILDESWVESQQDKVNIEKFSKIGIGNPVHSHLTLATIKLINKNLDKKVTGLSAERDNLLKRINPPLARFQPKKNIYEALQSLMMTLELKPGDIFIANVEIRIEIDKDSLVKDCLCRELLLKIINDFGVIVLVSSGNSFEALGISEDETGDIIVVGSFIKDGINFTTKSRFGEGVTCYAEGDEQIERFGDSSFATAQMAAVVMEMQKYVGIKNSANKPLTPAEVKNILKNKGKKITIAGVQNCNIPIWPDIQTAINEIRP